DQSINLCLFTPERLMNEASRDSQVVFGSLAKVGDKLTDDHTGNDGLGYRVAAQPVEAMHVPAGRLARREEAFQRRTLSSGICAHATHRVVLRWPYRNPVLRRINTKEIMADLVHLAQVVLDVMFAEQGDV